MTTFHLVLVIIGSAIGGFFVGTFVLLGLLERKWKKNGGSFLT